MKTKKTIGLLLLSLVMSIAVGCGGGGGTTSAPTTSSNTGTSTDSTSTSISTSTPTSTSSGTSANLEEITGVTLENKNVVYTGSEYELTVTGTIPPGVTVKYTDNKRTDVGISNAVAELSGANYITKTLNATLTVTKAEITGITFEDKNVVYNGTEHVVTITGTLPTGVTVKYTDNKRTNAGVSNAVAELSGANYVTKQLNATLTVGKAEITGITFEDETVPFDGTQKCLTITGNIPNGTSVEYTSDTDDVTNCATAVGTYVITATISGANYVTLNLEATLKITFDASAVRDHLETLLGNPMPDVYEFIPEELQPGANLISSDTPLDFSTEVDVTDIPSLGHGEQWTMVLDNIEQTKPFLSVLDAVSTASSVVTTAFTAFINANPADNGAFVSESGEYEFQVNFDEDVISLTLEYEVELTTVQIYIDHNTDTNERTGRIQLSDGNAMKYETSDTKLTLALKYAGVRRTYFSIEKQSDNLIFGELHEFLGLDDGPQTKSSAEFHITPDYTSVIGNKAPSRFIINKYTINELYLTSTGELLGFEIMEDDIAITFNVVRFNLRHIEGLNSIREDDDKFYVNGSATEFTPKTVSIINPSRRFDIQYRTMFFYYENDGEIEKVEMDIPMMFVQEEQLDDFSDDVAEENNELELTIDLDPTHLEKITDDYENLIPEFTTNAEDFTVDIILDYIGSEKEIEE